MCPGQWQEWCRYSTGALVSVRSGVIIVLLSLWISVNQVASVGDFVLAPECPIEKVALWEGLLYLGSETDGVLRKTKGTARTDN